MFENDFLMRQIELTARAIAVTIFKKGTVNEEAAEPGSVVISEESLLEYTFGRLVAEGKINEAEDFLFDEILAVKSEAHFALALAFYDSLGKLSDEQLAAHGFTRDEIAQGLEEINKMIGVVQL